MKTAQSTLARRMKLIGLIVCCVLTVITIILYSNTHLNWKFLATIIDGNRTESNETSAEMSRRFAIFACSIHSNIQAYSFYTPITAASWKRVGYETIVVFVGNFTEVNVLTGRLNLTRNYLKRVGATIIDLQCPSSYATKLSQLVRVFSGFLPDSIVQDDDFILTADSDLMPIKRSEYQPTVGNDGFIFNAFCCGSFQRHGKSYRMYPMGHIYLKKKTWRALIIESRPRAELLRNISDSDRSLLSENASISFEMISLYARHEFSQIYDSTMTKGDPAWFMDQVLCSMLLVDYRKKHPNLFISERGRAARLDRASAISYWNRDNFDQFGDAHLIHDSIFKEANWKIFTKLLRALFNQTLVDLFNDYYRQYVLLNQT